MTHLGPPKKTHFLWFQASSNSGSSGFSRVGCCKPWFPLFPRKIQDHLNGPKTWVSKSSIATSLRRPLVRSHSNFDGIWASWVFFGSNWEFFLPYQNIQKKSPSSFDPILPQLFLNLNERAFWGGRFPYLTGRNLVDCASRDTVALSCIGSSVKFP